MNNITFAYLKFIEQPNHCVIARKYKQGAPDISEAIPSDFLQWDRFPAMWDKAPLSMMILFIVFSIECFAQPSFDVLHYDIRLDISNLSAKSISGCATVKLKSETNGLQQIALSLLALTVDAVKLQQQPLSFQHTDETLLIQLPQPLNAGDSASIEICYHGEPVMDASGWGGFYFSGSYAFNLGVGFAADPHNYGRVWFPCVDNFTSRALYDFHITTASSHKAFCNGLQQHATNNPNGTVTWHWKLSQTIPTYLASVAVGPYTSVETTYQSLSGSATPVILAAQPGDTVNLKKSFIHLPDAFHGFEACYGNHPFERIGFALVPFSSGAMEHATNIAYPRYAANGSLQYETLMAHEFSHHWWGDLVTCATPEDMWLNEGWASYSESIFLEKVYGKERYRKNARDNHKFVLHFAHIQDDGYRAVSGVPHEYTYGKTVYEKGADVAHTLRGYMGDSLFFHCLKNYLEEFKFNHASSYDFRNSLSACSGIDLTAFFDNWVFSPGFPHFSVDSISAVPSGNEFDVMVFIRQRLKAAPHLYSGVPLDITFFSENFDSLTKTVLFSGSCGIHHTTLPFQPAFVAIDLDEKISDAITDKYFHLSTTGNYDFEEALMTMNVTQLTGNALARVEHHWLAPDPFKTPVPGLHISQERYWKVDGIFPNDFSASAAIKFDGTTSQSTGFLDNQLITNSEDSLVVLFRPDVKTEWTIYPSFTVDPQGSVLNKRGEIRINNIVKGEYALGIRDGSRAVADTQATQSPCFFLDLKETASAAASFSFTVFPNPAKDSFFIRFPQPLTKDARATVFDVTGKRVAQCAIKKGETQTAVPASGWQKSTYLVRVEDAAGVEVKRVIILE